MSPKDSDDEEVVEGDIVYFSFGIPPTSVKAEVISHNGKLYASTPEHKPKKCLISELEEHVGIFTKIEPRGSFSFRDRGFP